MQAVTQPSGCVNWKIIKESRKETKLLTKTEYNWVYDEISPERNFEGKRKFEMAQIGDCKHRYRQYDSNLLCHNINQNYYACFRMSGDNTQSQCCEYSEIRNLSLLFGFASTHARFSLAIAAIFV